MVYVYIPWASLSALGLEGAGSHGGEENVTCSGSPELALFCFCFFYTLSLASI